MSEEQAAYNAKPIENSKQARLMDGEKLLEWLQRQGDSSGAYHTLRYITRQISSEVESGAFDFPTDQGEAARLREALEVAFHLLEEHQPEWYLKRHYNTMILALSSNTEDTGAQKVKDMYSSNEGLYIIGIRDTLNALGITILGITDEHETDFCAVGRVVIWKAL